MTEQEQIVADQYRFSGYHLDMIILDETGPSYAVSLPHPYYYNQPAYWQKNAYQDAFRSVDVIGGDIYMENAGVSAQQIAPTTSSGTSVYRPTMFRMLSF